MGAFLIGLIVGCLYFGGLWLSVCRAARASCSGMGLMVSFAVRLLVLGAVMIAVASTGLMPLIWFLLAFYLSRQALLKTIGLSPPETKEAIQ